MKGWLSVLTITALVVFASCSLLLAQTSDVVGEGYEKCMVKAGNDVFEMVECGNAAYNAYRIEMDAIYRRVLDRVKDPKSKELVQAAQARWEEYREAEDSAFNGPWAPHTRIFNMLISTRPIATMRGRIRELLDYEDIPDVRN
jgi:uncharacterized protein YecT (DUF1311 family)